jgi:hypothetical protein
MFYPVLLGWQILLWLLAKEALLFFPKWTLLISLIFAMLFGAGTQLIVRWLHNRAQAKKEYALVNIFEDRRLLAMILAAFSLAWLSLDLTLSPFWLAADLVVSWFSYWLTELIYFEAIRVRLQRRG